jgi:hypothetical protein
MSVCVFCGCVVLEVAAMRLADPPSKESYRLCKRSTDLKSSQGPTKGCRAIDSQRDSDLILLQFNAPFQ